jgi:hypothetical protein
MFIRKRSANSRVCQSIDIYDFFMSLSTASKMTVKVRKKKEKDVYIKCQIAQ